MGGRADVDGSEPQHKHVRRDSAATAALPSPSPSSLITIDTEHKYEPYDVVTATASIRDHHDTIFNGEKKPLCGVMRKMFGRDSSGCETSAAFTSWTIDLTNNKTPLYNTRSGKKNAFVVKCTILIVMPKWSQVHNATAKERAEVRRFEMQTARHERGHGLAGEHVCQAIKRFLTLLPDEVKVADAARANAAAMAVMTKFYVPMSRLSDKAYDAETGHGLIQGAIAKRHVH